MASRSDDVLLSVCFGQGKLTLSVKRKDKVQYVIKKAAANLRESEDGLSLLYRGTRLPGDATVGEVMAEGLATVVHLQRQSNVAERRRPLTAFAGPSGHQTEPLNGFCRGECDNMLCSIAPVFRCNSCRKEGFFRRYQEDIPIDFHADDISPKQLMGSCSCGKENITATVLYQCKACRTSNVPFLRQLRRNLYDKPCMQCGKTDDTVFLFSCSSRHTMCLTCFSDMCKIQLDSGHFKNFPMLGYSVGCPGPGADCADSPVADPHHFYLIDSVGPYYQRFKEKSVEGYIPPGDNILCACKYEIDLASGKEVDVTPPGEPQASVGGGMWFLRKLLRRPPPPPPPPKHKTRRQVSCRQCQKSYCVECKQYWHEGDCQPALLHEDLSEHYQIDPSKAAASCWPQY